MAAPPSRPSRRSPSRQYYVRPHASLDGFTSVEAYYGIPGHLPRPVSPPREGPGDSEPEVPFEFVFLDPEHRAFPVLVPRAA